MQRQGEHPLPFGRLVALALPAPGRVAKGRERVCPPPAYAVCFRKVLRHPAQQK